MTLILGAALIYWNLALIALSLIKAKLSLFFKKVLITVNAHIRFRLPCLFSPMQESSEEIFVTVNPLKPETDEIYLILDEEIISVAVTGRKRTLFHCKWANSMSYISRMLY